MQVAKVGKVRVDRIERPGELRKRLSDGRFHDKPFQLRAILVVLKPNQLAASLSPRWGLALSLAVLSCSSPGAGPDHGAAVAGNGSGGWTAAGGPAASAGDTAMLPMAGSSPSGGAGEMGGSATGGQMEPSSSGSSGAPSGGGAGSSGMSGVSGSGGGTAPIPDLGTTVKVDATGKYSVTFKLPAWTFGGDLGAPASNIASTTGMDALGAYSETSFGYTNQGAREARIRAYAGTPVVVFAERNPAASTNARRFPRLSTYPKLAHSLAYSDAVFGLYSLTAMSPDSPWLYFDDAANTFILSAASHFMNTETRAESDASISTGISRGIANLPAGFEQSTVLVAKTGINQAFDSWGSALQRFGGKAAVANDKTIELQKLGYWTDNGAAYYYATAGSADYRSTLLQAKTYLTGLGLPAGYVQLDSWWYRKGSVGTWEGNGTDRGGTYLYEADPTLFPAGLSAFQKSLALPLMTHNRWIDAASPYRSQFKMSVNVSTDPAFWDQIATYLQGAGVTSYEQDWLNELAVASTTNLIDQDAFMDNMARAMAAHGISIQYCMPLPKHYLQSTKYASVVSSRVSNDKFARNRWKGYVYGSRLASAVGEWPWSDVFKSSDLDSLRLSLLGAGVFGVGDAINGVNKANVLRAVRTDGVIVKPDVPIVPLDKTIIDEARGLATPTVAFAYSAHPGGRTTYLFAFSDASSDFSVRPVDLGYASDIYVYDANRLTGKVIAAGASFSATVASTAYYVVAPIGRSGIAFLGDVGKIASAGKQRVATWQDDGAVTATLSFAAGESATVHGYAPSAPKAAASVGTVGAVTYDSATHQFSVLVTPAASSATITISL